MHIVPRASSAVATIVAAGGKRIGDKGYFIEPTVFANVKDDMKIAQVVVCAVPPLHFVVQLPSSKLTKLDPSSETRSQGEAAAWLYMLHCFRPGADCANSSVNPGR